ncbi:unnamed protein product [marine sediment metagenome]|uniref:Type 4 fimbrial biogenesis protein PilV n=1 Tax=marine sediment metagenome TaxID=412755 RepID=X1C3I7_9ZZZZ
MKNKKPIAHYSLPITNSGFGILEALIASGIIAIFAGGIVILGNMALRSVVINKHRLQAAYLAQEAVELVRNIRDSNWVDGDADTECDDGINDSGGNSLKLGKDPDDNWELVSGFEIIPLNNVIFTRKIRITKYIDSLDPLRKRTADIEVEILWEDYGKSKDVTINSIITDWMIY